MEGDDIRGPSEGVERYFGLPYRATGPRGLGVRGAYNAEYTLPP